MDGIENIKAVLFDFDGTLTQPGALDFPAIKRKLDCPVDLPILEFIETQPPQEQARLMKTLEEQEVNAAISSMPNSGAEKTILALLDRGYCLGILTRNSRKSLETAFLNFSIIDQACFEAILAREDAPPKPGPEGIYMAADTLGVTTESLIMVGDFRFDIMAGVAAEALTVLLTNNKPSPMLPDDPAPDYTVSRIDEVLDIVL